MSNKQYRLPKEFATKWVSALRSREYTQGQSQLYYNNTYCCLGVAAEICGYDVKSEEFEHEGCLNPRLTPLAPEELLVDLPGKMLSYNLMQMNDSGDFTFPQIADWIENNIEFY